jgi:hypothetical protein
MLKDFLCVDKTLPQQQKTMLVVSSCGKVIDEPKQNSARYFDIPRVRIGKKQTLETLINEEAGLLAQYLRGERKEWMPRLPRSALLYNSSSSSVITLRLSD